MASGAIKKVNYSFHFTSYQSVTNIHHSRFNYQWVVEINEYSFWLAHYRTNSVSCSSEPTTYPECSVCENPSFFAKTTLRCSIPTLHGASHQRTGCSCCRSIISFNFSCPITDFANCRFFRRRPM